MCSWRAPGIRGWPRAPRSTCSASCRKPFWATARRRWTIASTPSSSLGRRRLANVALTSFAQIVDLLVHTDHTAVVPWRIAQMHQARLSVHPVPLALPNYQLFVCWDRRSNADAGVLRLKDALVRIGTAVPPSGENSSQIRL